MKNIFSQNMLLKAAKYDVTMKKSAEYKSKPLLHKIKNKIYVLLRKWLNFQNMILSKKKRTKTNSNQ